ncbi:MAG: hypothetical protein ABJB78_00570 [Betaproteobacteria bacterium]
MSPTPPGPAEGPWNPGIESDLPRALLPQTTIFRAQNAFTTVAEAQDWHELTGLPLEELVVFRPERLLVHEVLVRVTGDIAVPDGTKVEDLGINFRRITHTILEQHLSARMPEILAAYEQGRQAIAQVVDAELAAALARADAPAPPVPTRSARGLFRALRGFRRNPAPPPLEEYAWEHEERMLREWHAKAQDESDAARRAAYRALIRAMSAVRGRHGHLWGDAALLAPPVCGLAANDYGAAAIGALIDPWVRDAALAEGFALLPAQAEPVVMNTKGASAAGKSTLRPQQKRLAAQIGVEWSDFALISPDIWRKYLLDYGALGEHYKYAGTFTGNELAIIDEKLDRYMARKAERGGMSHLLIDRFRFDSFAPDSEEAGSNLLTRFGHYVYLFFLITPPHSTVERSWKRGLDVGRYKAVDDLLAHNVEAYTGMPELFFTWALRTSKIVHFEFLDNSVPAGELPHTIAFGRNGEVNILDVKCMLDIDRYRKIETGATRPEDVYGDPRAMAAEANTAFLVQCVRMLPVVNFAERDSGRLYARIEGGRLAWTDPALLAAALADPTTRAGLRAAAQDIETFRSDAPAEQRTLDAGRYHTLGRWGASPS